MCICDVIRAKMRAKREERERKAKQRQAEYNELLENRRREKCEAIAAKLKAEQEKKERAEKEKELRLRERQRIVDEVNEATLRRNETEARLKALPSKFQYNMFVALTCSWSPPRHIWPDHDIGGMFSVANNLYNVGESGLEKIRRIEAAPPRSTCRLYSNCVEFCSTSGEKQYLRWAGYEQDLFPNTRDFPQKPQHDPWLEKGACAYYGAEYMEENRKLHCLYKEMRERIQRERLNTMREVRICLLQNGWNDIGDNVLLKNDEYLKKGLNTLKTQDEVLFFIDAHVAYRTQPIVVYAEGEHVEWFKKLIGNYFTNLTYKPLQSYDKWKARELGNVFIDVDDYQGRVCWSVNGPRSGSSVRQEHCSRQRMLDMIAQHKPIPRRRTPPNDGTRRPVEFPKLYGKNIITMHGGFNILPENTRDPESVIVTYHEECDSYYVFYRDRSWFRLPRDVRGSEQEEEKLVEILEALVTDRSDEEILSIPGVTRHV